MEFEPEKLAEMRRKRLEGLFDRYSKGARLSRAEMEEIRPFIERSGPPPAADPPRAAGTAADFRLEAEEPRFQRPYKEYAAALDVSERSIKKWVQKGRAAKDLPPLDDLPRMAEWYERVMNHRPPAFLLSWAEKKTAPAPASEARPAAPAPPQVLADASIDLDLIVPKSLEEQVEGLRRAEAACYMQLQRALTAGDASLISSRQAVYQRACETLRRAEKTLHDIQVQRGDYVLKADVAADMTTFARSLNSLHRTMAARVLEQLADLPADIRARVKASVEHARGLERALFAAAKTIEFPSSPNVADAVAA